MSNLQRKTRASYGIECFLRKQGIKTSIKNVSDLTASFLKHKGLEYVEFNPRYKGLFTANICNAEKVQEHFSEFREWVKNQVTKPCTS